MTISPKWLFGFLILWLVVAILTGMLMGIPLLGSGEVDKFGNLVSPNATIASITGIWTTITAMFNWGEGSMPFFNSGIGLFLRLILLSLSIVIGFSLAIDVIRLILPWKS